MLKTHAEYFEILLRVCCLVVCAGIFQPAIAEQSQTTRPLQVKVEASFLELHTGPGRGYPVFHVVERNAPLTLLFERAGWIKVETVRGRVGWVPRKALLETRDGTGEPPALAYSSEQWQNHRWQASLLGGSYDGASSLGVALGYRFTENITAETQYFLASGDFSNNDVFEINLQHQLFPAWRLSPYVMLGTGRATIEPRATLVRPENRKENYAQGGLGLKYYLARGFLLRTEYRSYVLFTEENQNRNIEEWKFGFSVLF
ncbi:SH3 domain-containing protein [Alcanivorax sp. DP30]|uniref:outer membrane beta-barrel protein n=1 Tax=Alcanivorax sp. DP30 TaxID=2606217 RepID=UPI00136E3534|nr:SH3 domain-containing protein [Alcanivorax sp. DP30]MZR63566.1 outer membrane beta-barrel protein [Alcanivorax sp. DP30]